MRSASAVVVVVLGLMAGPAHATGGAGHRSVEFSPVHFAAQREAILRGLNGETYRELGDERRGMVLEALSRLERRLEGIETIAEMDKRDQTAVFNDQELINSLLTRAAADSRLICKREKFVGSHRTTNVCITVAERRRLEEVAQNQLRNLQRSGYLPREVVPPGSRRQPGD